MTRRRGNGEGSVYKRKDGRWEAAATLETASGLRKRIRVYGNSRTAATAALRDVLSKADNGMAPPDKQWRVGEFLDYWLEQVVRPARRPATYCDYESTVRLHLKPGLAARSLTRLSVNEVQRYLNQQLKQDVSLRTVHKERAVLSTALARAQREGLVVRNVASVVELPSYRVSEVVPWSAAQVSLFLAATEDHQYYPAFLLSAVYGLRRGEVLGLRWCDVDLQQNVLTIRQQLQRVHGRLALVPLKTLASHRELPILPFVREELLSLRARNPSQADEPVVRASRGAGAVEPRNLLRGFQLAAARAGLPVIAFHHLRHGAATLLKNLGVPVKDVQALLGHADIHTTLSLYQHGDSATQQRAVAAAEQALFAVNSPRSRQISPSEPNLWNVSNRGDGSPLGSFRGLRPRLPELDDALGLTRVDGTCLKSAHHRGCQLGIGAVAVGSAVKDAAQEQSHAA